MPTEKSTLHVLLVPGGGREWSLKRLDKACELGLLHHADIIIFSGGGLVATREAEWGCLTEAEFMQQALERSHYEIVAEILIEKESKDTYQNIKNSLLLLEKTLCEAHRQFDYDNVVVVVASDKDHLERFAISWDKIAHETWKLPIEIDAIYKQLFGIRSAKEHWIEKWFFQTLHRYSPTGTRWPVSWIMNYQRKKRMQLQVAN